MQSGASVDDAAVEAIRTILATSFGASTARAVDFYFDTHIAVADPNAYTRMLRNTFMEGADHLVRTITTELCTKFGLSYSEGMTLAQCLGELREKSSSSSPPMRAPG